MSIKESVLYYTTIITSLIAAIIFWVTFSALDDGTCYKHIMNKLKGDNCGCLN